MDDGKKDEEKKAYDTYYKRLSKIINENQTDEEVPATSDDIEGRLRYNLQPLMDKMERYNKRQMAEKTQYAEGDLTDEKLTEGTSCLPCSSEHIGQAASLLKEAVRFAVREKGIKDEEVETRVHDALLELNALERKDLTPEKIAQMNPNEQDLAKYYMNKSAEIRHKLNDIKSPDDLIQASSLATNISKDIHKKVWDMSVGSGTVEKLCDKAGMTQKEKEECMEMVSEALEKQG